MDAMLEEELIDLVTFCLQNPESQEITSKRNRITQVGKELFSDGGVNVLENMFFVITNRIKEEIGKDPTPLKTLWNGISDDWKY